MTEVGQAVVLGGNSFNILNVQGNQATVDSVYTDRNGNAASIDRGDLYTDGDLLRLNNCANRTVFKVDATGVPVLPNGHQGQPTTASHLTIDDIRSGFVIAKNVAAITLKYDSTDPEVASRTRVEKLGPQGSLHTFLLFNDSMHDLVFDVGMFDPQSSASSRIVVTGGDLSRVHIYVESAVSARVFYEPIPGVA